MRTEDFHPPSWLSTLFFGAVIFLLFLCLATLFLMTWLPEPPPIGGEDWARAHERRESLISAGGIASGTVAAVLAAWAWRSQGAVRFQVAFISGVGILVITLTYIRHLQSFFSAAEHNSTRIGYDHFGYPLLALYSSAVGLLLILSAILRDRP